MENWIDLIGWIGLGAVLGFLYARRKLRASAERAAATLNAIEVPDLRRAALAESRGYYLGASLFAAVVGAVLGAGIYGLATLFLWIAE